MDCTSLPEAGKPACAKQLSEMSSIGSFAIDIAGPPVWGSDYNYDL